MSRSSLIAHDCESASYHVIAHYLDFKHDNSVHLVTSNFDHVDLRDCFSKYYLYSRSEEEELPLSHATSAFGVTNF